MDTDVLSTYHYYKPHFCLWALTCTSSCSNVQAISSRRSSKMGAIFDNLCWLVASFLPTSSRQAWSRRATGTKTDPPQVTAPGTRRHDYNYCRDKHLKWAKYDIRAMIDTSVARQRFAFTDLLDQKNKSSSVLRDPPPTNLPSFPEINKDHNPSTAPSSSIKILIQSYNPTCDRTSRGRKRTRWTL